MTRAKRWHKRKKRNQGIAVFLLGIIGLCVVLCGAAFVGVMSVANSWLQDLPDYSSIDEYAENGYSTVYASDRKTILAKITLENRIKVSEDEVSQYVLDGTVATEDERFYSHNGVDLHGILRAAVANLSGGQEGASTITQQLVRNTILLSEMDKITYERKIREMYLAIKVEQKYSKDEILMMYLNVINYGDRCYGIEAASRDYFGCSASELDLAQAAMLVGIPQSPTANCPRSDYETSLARGHVVLQRMLKCGYITQEEYDAAMQERPELAEKSDADEEVSNIAPYFVDYIRTQATSENLGVSELSKGGLSIYTTLDVKCQKAANKAVKEGLSNYDDEIDSSLTSIDPDNGYIVAMVGGRNYAKNEFNLSTQMSRQAGSSFKPFTLLTALKLGVDPNTSIDSSAPAEISPTWTVGNSEGEGGGNMTLTAATTASVNTVYARVAHVLGAKPIVQTAKDCGITSDLQEVESICLGTQGVNTLEMADAYATIANGGIHHDPVCITDIQNSKGKTLYKYKDDGGKRVLSKAVAQKATEILETVITSGTGTSARLSNYEQPAAGKTGTSEEGRDLWFCGFTPQYATAVWSGYRQEKATGYYGGTISAPIWKKYMDAVLANKAVEEFPTTTETITYTNKYTFPTYTGPTEEELAEQEKEKEKKKNAKKETAGDDAQADTGEDTSQTDSGGTEETPQEADTEGGEASGGEEQ